MLEKKGIFRYIKKNENKQVLRQTSNTMTIGKKETTETDFK